MLAHFVMITLTTFGLQTSAISDESNNIVRRNSKLSNPYRLNTDDKAAVSISSSGSVTASSGTSRAECEHDRAKAISNFRRGSGAIWFYHITHNAGTSFRYVAQKNTKEHTPPKGSVWYQDAPPTSFSFPWEEKMLPSGVRLEQIMPCTSDDWVSVISMRHPVGRILSGDGRWTTTGQYNVNNCNTDNYGLRMLIGKKFDEPITKEDVALAKQRLDSFDFVLDVGDFTRSLKEMCYELGWSNCTQHPMQLQQARSHQNTSAQDKVPAELYAKWMHRNRYEIELYQYAQNISRRLIATLPMEAEELKSLTETSESFADQSESDLEWICPRSACATCQEDALH
jgi:hypothetical protein